MLTAHSTAHLTLASIQSGQQSWRRGVAVSDDALANKSKIARSIQSLVDITNEAIKEHFFHADTVTAIQSKMHALERKIASRRAAGQRRITKQETALAALRKLWDHAGDNIVPIEADGAKAISFIHNHADTSLCEELVKLIDDNKEFYDNQVRTMVRLMFFLLLNPKRAGTIVGALQSGKTGIGMAMKLMMAPMLYLLTGVRIYPHFISTNQTNHVQQSEKALKAFLSLYGAVEFYAARDSVGTLEDGLDQREAGDLTSIESVGGYFMAFNEIINNEMSKFRISNESEHANFVATPTMNNYKNTVSKLKGAVDEDEIKNIGEVLIRTPGHSVEAVRRLMEIASKNDFYLMLILDEPQWGSSGNHANVNANGKLSGGVLNQMFFEHIKKIISPENMHMLIGLSATPFGLTEANNLFTMHAYIADGYYGPNCFNGKIIDPSKPHGLAAAPVINSWDTLDVASGVAGANNLRDLLAGDRKPKNAVDATVYRQVRRLMGGEMLYRVYCSMVSDKANLNNYGMLLRARQSNDDSTELADEADLARYFNVVKFYANDADVDATARLSADLKGELAKYRGRDGKPVLILVTGKARMGDSFPSWIEFFMDFTPSTTGDMNAKLQGVFGRACGVGKPHSKVFVNSAIASDLRRYILTDGAYVGGKSSPHTVREGSQDRTREVRSQCGIIGIRHAKDAAITAFLNMVEAELNLTNEPVSAINQAGGNNKIDIVGLLEKSAIIDHLTANRSTLFPKHLLHFLGLNETRAHEGKTLVWPNADGGPTVAIRHSTEAWYANPLNTDRHSQSFETHNRYYLSDRESRKETKVVRDQYVVLNYGMHADIDAVLDHVSEQASARSGKVGHAPAIDMPEHLSTLKSVVEANHASLFNGRYSALTLIAGGDIWSNFYRKNRYTAPLHFVDGKVQMRTTKRADAVRVTDFQQHTGQIETTIQPMIIHDNGRLVGIAWPVNGDVTPRNRPGEANLNIQINCGKFDDQGNELTDATSKGQFRVTSICLPLFEQMAPNYANEADLLSEVHFLEQGLDSSQRRSRNTTIIANGGELRPRPVFPAPQTKPIKARKAKSNSRMSKVTV